TANAFSLPGLALSTANLYTAVQPGGSLYGLQHSNPVDTSVAYGGSPNYYGQPNDPMNGGRIGGVNVFGGGLALYNSSHQLVGAIGVSGDSSCADHNIAWRARHTLNLDFVPGGVSGDSQRPDNIVYDINPQNGQMPGVSPSGWGHPACSAAATAIAAGLPPTQ
ncbi:MAG TPA: heme-binding protein, partial [Candidatus Solibacter sp.]|nr:heme-binding protein [Candidatus Solibacter sp.]